MNAKSGKKPEVKPVVTTAQTKEAEVKPAETKEAEVKPAETKTLEAKAAEVKAALLEYANGNMSFDKVEKQVVDEWASEKGAN